MTSDRIVAMFTAHGYELVERRRDPLIHSAGELVILRRAGFTARPTAALTARPQLATVDYRAKPIVGPGSGHRSARRHETFARDWLPPKLLRGLRELRRRLG